MQDPSIFQQMNPQFPEHEQLKCPRCDSPNTKFCYYNNYNLSQPRHYCKSCRRYWTKGGSLRNIPVGGATRKANKRATSASKRSAMSSQSPNTPNPTVPKSESLEQDRRMFLTSNDQFRNLIQGLNSNGFGKDPIFNPNSSSDQNSTKNPVGELQSGNNAGIFLGVDENGGDSSYWGSSNGWPDLSIYTPRSTFQ